MKNQNYKTATTIRELLKIGKTPLEVANLLNVSRRLVYKWKNKDPEQPKKTRKSKLKARHIKRIRDWAADKYTGVDGASSRNIAKKLNMAYRTLNISHRTANTWLNKILSRPRTVRKVF